MVFAICAFAKYTQFCTCKHTLCEGRRLCTKMSLLRLLCILFLIEIEQTLAFFVASSTHTFINTSRQASVEDSQPNAKSNEEEVSQLLEKAAQLRREASTLSSTLPAEKDPFPPPVTPPPTILILGANSPLGAKLCRGEFHSVSARLVTEECEASRISCD